MRAHPGPVSSLSYCRLAMEQAIHELYKLELLELLYNRYQVILKYFDSLVVALTATLKSAIDHNAYELFGCSDEDPTFEYPMEAAIPVYVKGYENYDVSTQFLREGIRYADLSERGRERY